MLEATDSALKVFDEMPEPNITLINAVISGFAQNGNYKKSFDVFKCFSVYKCRPDSVTIASFLSGFDTVAKDGQQVHYWVVKIGVETDIYVATSLITIIGFPNACWKCSKKCYNGQPTKRI